MPYSDAWGLELLACPACGDGLAPDPAGARCTACGRILALRDGVWRGLPPAGPGATEAPEPEQARAGNPYRNIDYQDRAADPFTTTAREMPQYLARLEEALRDFGPFPLALDLGCGDGRFTRWLLANGVDRVMAVDLDAANLARCAARLGHSQAQRVTLLQADVTRLPLRPGHVPAIFALGLLNVFGPDMPRVCAGLRELLAPDGLLVNSEPTLEGSLLYALVRHDLAEFSRTVATRSKTTDIERSQAARVPVLAEDEMPRALAEAGLECLRVRGISVLPSLVFGGLLRLLPASEQTRQALAALVDSLDPVLVPVHRVKVYYSRRAQAPRPGSRKETAS